LKVFGVGMHHDHIICTRKSALTNWGHSWVILHASRFVGAMASLRFDHATSQHAVF
jgi:hypothetical protein